MPEKASFDPAVFHRPLLTSLAITCCYFILGWLFFTPFFQSNDDMVLNWITQGFGLVDHPSEFLVLVNVLVGLVLKNLNLFCPSVPWFGVGLFLVFFLSVWALLAALFSRERSPWMLLFFGLLGTPLFFHCFAWPQYTVYGLLAAISGVLLLVHPIRPGKLSDGMVLVLLVVSSLIRLEPALFTLAAGLVYILTGNREEVKGRLKVLSAALLLIFFGVGFDRWYVAAHPGWKEARTYFDRRFSIDEIKVTDYERQKAAFQAVGWEPEDYRMFTDTFYAGPAFDLDKLQRLDSLLKVDYRVKWELLGELIQNSFVQMVLMGLGAGIFLTAMFVGRGWGPLVWVLAMILILVLFQKIVARVLWPLLLFADLVMLFTWPVFPKLKRGLAWAAILLALVLAGGAFHCLKEDWTVNRTGAPARLAILDSLEKLSPRPDQLFIIWGPSFPFAGFPIFRTVDSLKGFKFFWMSWQERTPYGEERLDQFHIRNLLKDTVDRPDVFWLLNDPDRHLEDYCREHAGMDVRRRLVFHGYFDVYQLASARGR